MIDTDTKDAMPPSPEPAGGPREPPPPVDLAESKREFVQTFFRRAEELTEALLRENERLRYRVLELEAKGAPGVGSGEPAGPLRELLGKIEALESERDQVMARFRLVQRDSFDFEQRSREVERENNNLANLYVASYQLHSTLDLREISRIITEILLNFVGARLFAVYLLDEPRGQLVPLSAEGLAREQAPHLPARQGVVGAVVTTGKALLDGGGPGHRGTDLSRPLVVSPLRIGDRVVGAIVIWEFLQQKSELADVDHELLNLLAAHAASAIQSALLAAEHAARPPALWAAVDLV